MHLHVLSIAKCSFLNLNLGMVVVINYRDYIDKFFQYYLKITFYFTQLLSQKYSSSSEDKLNFLILN